MPVFLKRGHLMRPERETSGYEFPPFHEIKSDSSMRLIIEEAQSRSLREGDFYDEVGITPALNLAQRLASERCPNCLEPKPRSIFNTRENLMQYMLLFKEQTQLT